MDCHQARHRLTGDLSLDSVSRADDELQRHLASCEDCRRLAEASFLLQRAFDQTRTEHNDSATPAFSEVRRTLEQAAAPKPWRGFVTMSDFWRYGSGRRRWGVGLGVFACVLALVTLVPFQYEKTVGYEVALAGVDPALAHDEERLRVLLSRLGAENATVEWVRCDTTCEVRISDLEELKQCQMLVCAIQELGPVEVVEGGLAICQATSGPIVELAKSRVWEGRSAAASDEEIRQMVQSCLGRDFAPSSQLSVCNPGASAAKCALPCVPDSGSLCVVVMCADSTRSCATGNKSCGMEATCVGPNHAKGDAGQGQVAAKSGDLVPGQFMLAQNHPNPFNPDTRIEFALDVASPVKLEVFNTLGRKVRTLVDEHLSSGVHTVSWDARSDDGDRVPSGTYLYRLTTGTRVVSKTMTLLK